MSGRIYVEILTIGQISIYQVTTSPDGSLSATVGSLAIQGASPPTVWQNTDGAQAWQTMPSQISSEILVDDATLAPLADEVTGNLIVDA